MGTRFRVVMEMASAGYPVDTVSASAPWTVTYMPGTSQGVIDAGDAFLAALDLSDAATATWYAVLDRATAAQLLDAREAAYTLLRGVVSATMDELNNLRQWLTDFKAAVAGAGSLAALKTAVAALPNTPDRTLAQARDAIKAAIDAGGVDS